MTTENHHHHDAKEIFDDINSNHAERAGAKLREIFQDPAELKKVADDLKTLSKADSNWNNDVEVIKDKNGDVKEIVLNTVPFTGDMFGTKLFDKNDREDVSPTEDILMWNRMAFYKIHKNSDQ